MEDVVPVLQPLADVTEMLAKEDLPTLSCVHVLIPHLMTSLAPHELNTASTAQMKQNIIKGMMTRFRVDNVGIPTYTEVNVPLLATFLDPRYKTLKCLPPSKREMIQDCIISLMSEPDRPAQQPSTTVKVKEEPQDDVAPPACKKMLLDCLMGDIVDLTQENIPSTSELELERFISERVTVADPLLWWKMHGGNFPKLAPLARKYLAIPATEVPSERVFSAAGLTITKLRASLDPHNVDMILFVHKNHTFPELSNVMYYQWQPPQHL